ncbi:MAG TPA: hypothetical protein VE978_09595 [Chitinophagales bacterium]|nr:hypothetical protein [Chitinophagales bacterium]
MIIRKSYGESSNLIVIVDENYERVSHNYYKGSANLLNAGVEKK